MRPGLCSLHAVLHGRYAPILQPVLLSVHDGSWYYDDKCCDLQVFTREPSGSSASASPRRRATLRTAIPRSRSRGRC
jgi:hypothetical protein